MEEFIKIFKALGDETRVNILLLISNRGMCAKGIACLLYTSWLPQLLLITQLEGLFIDIKMKLRKKL